MLAVVYAFKRPHQYLICSKVVVFTDSSALKFLMTKRDAKPRLFRLELLLQEFDFELKDQKGSEIVVAHHLSRLPEPNDESSPIQDEMFEETLMTTLVVGKAPWFADIANYLACRELPEFESRAMKKACFRRVGNFFWDDPYLFHACTDGIIRYCITKEEVPKVLTHCHTRATTIMG